MFYNEKRKVSRPSGIPVLNCPSQYAMPSIPTFSTLPKLKPPLASKFVDAVAVNCVKEKYRFDVID